MLVLVVYIRCSVGDPREPIGGSPYEGAEEARRARRRIAGRVAVLEAHWSPRRAVVPS